MKLKVLALLPVASLLLATLGGSSFNVMASTSAVAPSLGTAASFVGLAGSTFTNTGSGIYYGNVGTSPGSSITGFPPGQVLHGAIYRGGAVPTQAQLDATNAYTVLGLESCSADLTGQDLGGMTLAPGVYCFDTSAQLTGDLVLDANGDSNAVWVFKMGSTLTTASGATVRMINGGQALNVFWHVGSSATLGTTTRFSGNILAEVSITLDAGASLQGRALALTGAVTMDTHGSPPISVTITDLSIVKSVNKSTAVPGQTITYTLTFSNVGNSLVTGITITDIIPINVTATHAISSGVAITRMGGTPYVWNVAPLAAGQGGIITITGQVSTTLPSGIFTNTATIATIAQDIDNSNNNSSIAVVYVASEWRVYYFPLMRQNN
jgi:uncharacterized repeat protein (TIGR01451 family)